MKINFKAAQLADTDMLTVLRNEFIEIEAFPHPLDVEMNHFVLRELLANEQFGKVWLIECDGQTAGYLVLAFGYSLEYAGRDAMIDELYLRESFRGRGIGQQTIAFIEDFCHSNDIKVIHLEVEHGNQAAQALYRKTGFVNHERYFLTKWI